MSQFDEICKIIFYPPNASSLKQKTQVELRDDIKKYRNAFFGKRINFPSIIFAGTKGKGSTSTASESIARALGLRTLLYTSPHLISPLERIKVNGDNITEEEFTYLYKETQRLLNENKLENPPFFHCYLTLMFGIFMKNQFENDQVDIALIEVGIGGRFDWTKIFKPTICVISHLEYDHTEILGKTAELITWNKFGITSKNSINFSVIQKNVEFRTSLENLIKETGRVFSFVEPEYKKEMGLKGPTAEINTSLAIQCVKKITEVISIKKKLSIDNMNENVKNQLIENGAKNTKILGRYEIVEKDDIEWMIDGAHTFDSVRFCLEWYENEVSKDFKDIYTKNSDFFNYENTIILCATSKNREPEAILGPILEKKWKSIYYIKSYGQKNPKMIKYQKNIIFFDKIEEALDEIHNVHPKIVLVTGSLYLVEAVLKNFIV